VFTTPEIAVAFACSGIISLLLLIFLWRGHETVPVKLLLSVVLLIPVAGPIFYLFATVMSSAPAQAKCLKNRGPRGEYTHSWITMKPIYEEIVREKKARMEKSRDNDT
jgi:hypothetical protein